VRADDDLGRVARKQELERGQRGPDPRVVRNLSILERHVEIRANEHAFAGNFRVADRARLSQFEREPSDDRLRG